MTEFGRIPAPIGYICSNEPGVVLPNKDAGLMFVKTYNSVWWFDVLVIRRALPHLPLEK
jgi:hypothetical protein